MDNDNYIELKNELSKLLKRIAPDHGERMLRTPIEYVRAINNELSLNAFENKPWYNEQLRQLLARAHRDGGQKQASIPDNAHKLVAALDEAIVDLLVQADQKAPAAHDEGHPHLVKGEFQSDKYPTTPRGKVPLSVKDKTAQDLLWEYAQRRRAVDAEFGVDLELALRHAGYVHDVRSSYLEHKKPNKPGLWIAKQGETKPLRFVVIVDGTLGGLYVMDDLRNRLPIEMMSDDIRWFGPVVISDKAAPESEVWRSIPPHDMILYCPKCKKQHLDVGEFETRVHRKHLCENTPDGPNTGCGHLWTPFPYATRGVLTLEKKKPMTVNVVDPRPTSNVPSPLFAMSHELATQDNLGTADPIFIVQERVRDFGYENDDGDAVPCYVHTDGEVITEANSPARFAQMDRGRFEDGNEDDWHHTHYRERWQFVQPFLTRKAADEFRANQAHNLGETRVYVESGHRNPEWKFLRATMLTFPEFVKGVTPER